MARRIWTDFLVVVALLSVSSATEEEKVLTLDHSNFTDVVSKHDFIVVEFYAPWCGHCKALAPEYEKAANILSSNDPPVVLAKVDANEEVNRPLATQFEIQGFPTIKILRNGGKTTQDYNGGRDADSIVEYLKRQLGPASTEIKTAEDASNIIDVKKIYIAGIFPAFSGEAYENYTTVAEKLRSDYTFGHTLDAKFLPHGDSVSKPTLRVLKPFDEPFVDSQDFNVEALEKFIQQSTVPLVVVWDSDPANHAHIGKFFESSSDKAMVLVNFSKELDAFQTKVKDVATLYKGKGISFLLGDVDSTQNVFQYFGLKTEQAPLLVVQKPNGDKYLKANIDADQIAPWVKEYAAGEVKQFVKSEPIPEVNDEPVKVVVRDSLDELVLNSGKNVLLEFYAPWCGHCKKLAPTLDEVAVSFKDDPDVLIAKFDATANDVPGSTFEVQGFPTIYFRSASGNLSQYDGDRTKEDIISFIEKNRDKPAHTTTSAEPEPVKPETVDEGSLKDEL